MTSLKATEERFRAQGETVVERLRHHAAARADDPFFHYGEDDRTLSFGEFDALTNRIANGLRAAGIERGDRVSVYQQNALTGCLAMMGIWKAGALYCPINNRYFGELLAYTINDTRPAILIVDHSLLAQVNAVAYQLDPRPRLLVRYPAFGEHDHVEGSKRVHPDSSFETCSFESVLAASAAHPGVTVTEADAATIMYTSGTTGMPKGVVQKHGFVHNVISTLLHTTHPDDVIYSDFPLNHVGGAVTLFCRAAWSGCRIAMWDRFSASEFWRRIERCGANYVILVGVMIEWLMQQPRRSDDHVNRVNRVYVQPLPGNHHEMAQRFGFDFVDVGYGSSEAGMVSMGFIDELGARLGTPEHLWRGFGKEELRRRMAELMDGAALVGGEQIEPGFMGVPQEFFELRVCDADGTEVRSGTSGHVIVRSRLPNLTMCEYFNNPSQTAAVVKEGWFQTADFAIKDERGRCYFQGRQTGLIRVRGENVAASLVENQIRKNPLVAQCAVVPIPAAGNEDDIAVFIVLNGSAKPDAAGFKTWFEANLPTFMRPRHVRFIDAMPVTETMKVQTHKLRAALLEELGK